MLFDIITGIWNAVFLFLSLLYPLRRMFQKIGKAGKLKLHCIAGLLLLLASLVHVNIKLLFPGLSFGFAAFVALILVVITGVWRRYNRKSKLLRNGHVLFAIVFVLAFLFHAVQQIMNLFMM